MNSPFLPLGPKREHSGHQKRRVQMTAETQTAAFQATQRPEAGIHRRGSGREGVPRLDRPQLQLLQARQAQAVPLRGRDRRGPARPAALPVAGLAVRVRRRPRRLPARLDGAEGLGLRPARARALPRLRRQGLRVARARLARVPRPERGVGAHPLPLQLQRRAAAQPERGERPPGEGVRAVEPELGAVRRAEHRRVDARGPRPRPLPVRERAAPGPHEHAQQRDLGQLDAPHQGGPGPRALQPDADRGSPRLRRQPRTWRPGTPTRPGRASGSSPSSSPGSGTGPRRSSPPTSCSSRWSASCSAASWCSRSRRATATS